MDDQRISPRFVRALNLADLPDGQSRAINLDGNVIALFNTGGRVFAVDNRCPHMGFPLDRGSVKDCILTCHWHHARFDLATGGTFDQWADDVRAFPVRVDKGVIWVDLAEQGNLLERQTQRLGDGLERNIPLVIAKSVIALLERGEADPVVPFRKGLDFGVRNRREGWGRRPHHADLHDEPGAVAGPRGSLAGALPGARQRRGRLRRQSAALHDSIVARRGGRN
ncbi:MAG: Rieske (2Fe-2S) protein [Candidatus Binataceae bacterium]